MGGRSKKRFGCSSHSSLQTPRCEQNLTIGAIKDLGTLKWKVCFVGCFNSLRLCTHQTYTRGKILCSNNVEVVKPNFNLLLNTITQSVIKPTKYFFLLLSFISNRSQEEEVLPAHVVRSERSYCVRPNSA